ncbi:MAG: TIGR01244 family sulfur transferase [Sphingomicrobium sp.]
MLRQLDPSTLVSGQIAAADLAQLPGQGVTMIVNNRPDGEEPDQPSGAEIQHAAEQLGIAYRHIPILRGIGPADVEAMRDAIRECGDGKMLAFCRSGTRSTLAWALARAEDGVPRDELERCAGAAGIDLSPIAHLL